MKEQSGREFRFLRSRRRFGTVQHENVVEEAAARLTGSRQRLRRVMWGIRKQDYG